MHRRIMPLLALLVGCTSAPSVAIVDAGPVDASVSHQMKSAGPYALLLSSALTSVATSLTVTDGSLAPLGSPNFTIGIDAETLYVTAISGNSWTATRGYAGTSAAAHNAWVPVTILSGSGGAASGTSWQTVTSGQTATLLPTDGVLFDTSNSADAGTATAVLPSTPGAGECHPTLWKVWASSPVPPRIAANAVDGGALMVPYAGMAASGAAGLSTWTANTTPGSPATWCWDGSEWMLR